MEEAGGKGRLRESVGNLAANRRVPGQPGIGWDLHQAGTPGSSSPPQTRRPFRPRVPSSQPLEQAWSTTPCFTLTVLVHIKENTSQWV